MYCHSLSDCGSFHLLIVCVSVLCPSLLALISVDMGQIVMKLGRSVGSYVKLFVLIFHKSQFTNDIIITSYSYFLHFSLLTVCVSQLLKALWTWTFECGFIVFLSAGTMMWLTWDLNLKAKTVIQAKAILWNPFSAYFASTNKTPWEFQGGGINW